jgi:hypothetical protein
MGRRLHERMYADMYKAAGVEPDDVDGKTELEMDLQFDAALMDAVLAHWTRRRITAVCRMWKRTPSASPRI